MPSKFDFISPDIVVREVDLSELPPEPSDDGILIIGQAKQGPAMKPIRVNNLDDLEAVFGSPYGGDRTGDIWRNGNTANPTYGMFAAQAWLASNTSPVTYVRLAGEETGAAYTNGKAGWDLGGLQHSTNASEVVTAYGLWMVPSASSGTANGTLAGIFYTKGASLTLSGTIAGTTDTTSSVGTMIACIDKNAAFKVQVYDGSTTEDLKFNMTVGSKGFIREVCNTDPHKLISGQKSQTKKYFLGETFETDISDVVLSVGSSSIGEVYGILLPLAEEDDTDAGWVDHVRSVTAAKTGWFIGNDLAPTVDTGSYSASDMPKLFRFHSLIEGEEFQKRYCTRLKVNSVANPSDINAYTNFQVQVYDMKSGQVAEEFGCDLNPNSENYIAKVIGDQETTWNSTKDKFVTTGEFMNVSSYIRVEMSGEEYANSVIPFGFYGPAKPKDFAIAGHATPASIPTELDSGTGATYVAAGNSTLIYGGHGEIGWANYQVTATSSFTWPSLNLTDNNMSARFGSKNYFGFRGQQEDSSNAVVGSYILESDYLDILRALPNSEEIDSTGTYTETSFIFTLDDVVQDSTDAGKFYYEEGSHVAGTAYTSLSGSTALIDTAGIDKLIAPFMGGSDGVDVQYVDPFSSDRVLATGNKNDNYAIAAIDKAIEFVSDSEMVQYDMIAMPGIDKQSLVDTLVGNTEQRGDALAIVDIDSGFQSGLEYSSETAGSVATVISNVKAHNFNTSYAATYYPEIKIAIANGSVATMPSSIAGVGAIASSERQSGAPWFAPAGFNRGGIGTLGGSQGPKVSGVAETLKKTERDKLYLVNINPIANFPAEGPVVFGQKTLQQVPSALDRINVRRLMIYLKKRIGEVARTILFDNNVQATWNRFTAGADPILADAKSRFGLAEYKLVLDETTTTPDFVDRNIMYAKVFIKPAYAIEFIAIDFNITRSGIEF